MNFNEEPELIDLTQEDKPVPQYFTYPHTIIFPDSPVVFPAAGMPQPPKKGERVSKFSKLMKRKQKRVDPAYNEDAMQNTGGPDGKHFLRSMYSAYAATYGKGVKVPLCDNTDCCVVLPDAEDKCRQAYIAFLSSTDNKTVKTECECETRGDDIKWICPFMRVIPETDRTQLFFIPMCKCVFKRWSVIGSKYRESITVNFYKDVHFLLEQSDTPSE